MVPAAAMTKRFRLQPLVHSLWSDNLSREYVDWILDVIFRRLCGDESFAIMVILKLFGASFACFEFIFAC
jgi:hypothetical protein